MNFVITNEDRELLVELMRGAISIPSVKSEALPGAPFGPMTVKALHYFLDKAGSLGFRTSDLDGYAGFIEFGEGENETAALCHLDIVPPGDGWTSDPYTLSVRDGKFIGRGSSDDKGPAVACLMAMKVLKDSGWKPAGRIRLILGLDEESGCECMEHYKKCQRPPDIGFTPDAKFPVIFAEKGILHIRFKSKNSFNSASPVLINIRGGDKANMVPSICEYSVTINDDRTAKVSRNIKSVVRGRSSHASLPQYGENAISKAVSEISALLKDRELSHPFIDFYKEKIAEKTDGSLIGLGFSDSLSGDLTFNVGLISVTNDAISMTVDIRYPVTYSKEQILETLISETAGYGFEVDLESHMDPLVNDPQSKFVRSLCDVYNEATGECREPIAIGGGTYARRMPNIVAFGPVFEQSGDVAHQADEFITEKDLLKCVDIYSNAFMKLDSLLGDS